MKAKSSNFFMETQSNFSLLVSNYLNHVLEKVFKDNASQFRSGTASSGQTTEVQGHFTR